MKIVSATPHKAETYDVYVETVVERRITVRAISEEEAMDLAYKRATERTKTFTNRHYKVLEHEVIQAIARQ